MKLFERLSFKRKLLLFALVTCGAAMVLQTAVYFGYEVVDVYRDLPEDLSVTADIVGQNVSAALMFEDRTAASEALSGLSADDNILAACVLTAAGKPFARYLKEGQGVDTTVYQGRDGHEFFTGELRVSRPIELDGERIGYVIIRYSLAELYADLRNLAVGLVLFFGVSLLLAFAPAARLQRYISEPIVDLAAMTKKVAESKDFALRATRRSDDELGDLTDSFNQMLEQIQQRDSALQTLNEQLEVRVVDRTSELQKRTEELEERRRTVALLQSVATSSNAATTLSEALQVAIDEVCEYSGWPVGHAYLLAEDGSGDLVPTSIWHIGDGVRYDEVRSTTEAMPFKPGVGLPGRVASSRKPAWIVDVRCDTDFARVQILEAASLRAAFAFPVIFENDAVAILEFFHTDTSDPDEQLLRAMTSVGTSLSRVVERQRATDALREREHKLREQNTEILKASRALAESENHLRTIYDSEPECVKTVAPDGTVLEMNPAGLRMVDAGSLDDVRGTSVFGLVTDEHVERYRDLHRRVIEGESGTLVFEICGFKGRRVWMETHAVPLRNESGAIYAHLAVTRDITEERKAVQALRGAKEAAEAGNRAKSEFLANMSHEIRTPLNGIIGMSELALDTNPTGEQAEFLKSVLACSGSLLAIINDILDFSKIEAGKMSLEATPFDLVATCEAALDIIAHRAAPKNLELISSISPDAPHRFLGDPGRLRQVLINLLGNAEKFTEQGEISLLVDVLDRTDDDVTLKFSVGDTGTGIAEDRLAAIFESFTQADGATTRQYGGTGLGLAISRQLVELMGAQLQVESELGVGSTFHFTITLAIAPNQTADGSETASSILPDKSALRGTSILVVDDNKTNRQVLDVLLTSWGCRVALSRSGPEALEMLRATAGSNRSIDVVVLDVQMPEMDGLEVEQRIRENEALGRPKIVFASSLGNRKCVAELVGGDTTSAAAFLTKPIKRDLLMTTLLSAIGAVGQASVPEETRSDRNGIDQRRFKSRVLLVEDNPVNRKVAVGILKKLGCDISIAENGRIALEVLQDKRFDVILMDVQMPEMDGLEATRHIRADQRHNDTPIVAMTAHAMDGDRQKCLAAGMDDYLSKPISSAKLRKMVEAWTRRVTPDSPEPATTT